MIFFVLPICSCILLVVFENFTLHVKVSSGGSRGWGGPWYWGHTDGHDYDYGQNADYRNTEIVLAQKKTFHLNYS